MGPRPYAIAGTVIGALILGVGAYIQDIVKGLIIAAVIADQYRRKRRKV